MPANSKKKCFETLWGRGMQCFLFPEPATRNKNNFWTLMAHAYFI